MGSLLEFLRRLGSATADAAVGFLFSEDIKRSDAEDETARSQSEKSSGESGKMAPAKAPETVQNSPLDSFGEGFAESIEGLDASHDHEASNPLTPEMPSQDEGMDHSR
jgi:hypothetical protein